MEIALRRGDAGFLALIVTASLCGSSRADDQVTLPLREGWRRTVTIPSPKPLARPGAVQPTVARAEPGLRSHMTIRVENGWVVVRRETLSGLFEWQVVLARASGPAPPEIIVDETTGALTVNYRGYFIREPAAGWVRIYRERKTDDAPAWPMVEVARRDQRRERSAHRDASGPFMESWDLDYWTWLECGPVAERPDVCVRLRPATERVIHTLRPTDMNLALRIAGGPMEILDHDSYAAEEGDLLIVSRGTPETADRGLAAGLLSAWLKKHEHTDEALPITARKRLNDPTGPLLLQDHLKGAVTVVCFWSATYEPSVKALAHLEEVHRKYAQQGVKAVGIHVATPEANEPAIRKTIEEHAITLPIMIDRIKEGDEPVERRPVPGETAERYLVDLLPAFFLIDKSGKLTLGFATAPPTAAQIEAALK